MLHNIELKVSYSTKDFKKYKEYIDSFEPEILIEPEFKNFIEGEDLVINRILEYK